MPLFMGPIDTTREDADEVWRILRNRVFAILREDGFDDTDLPDVEEIAILADRGFDSAESIVKEWYREKAEQLNN